MGCVCLERVCVLFGGGGEGKAEEGTPPTRRHFHARWGGLFLSPPPLNIFHLARLRVTTQLQRGQDYRTGACLP